MRDHMGGLGKWLAAVLALGLVTFCLLFWLAIATFVHGHMPRKDDGIRRARNVTAAELYEQFPESRRWVPPTATDIAYLHDWGQGFKREGQTRVSYALTDTELRQAIVEAGTLQKITAPIAAPDGTAVEQGWYRKEGEAETGFMRFEVYDTKNRRVWKYLMIT